MGDISRGIGSIPQFSLSVLRKSYRLSPVFEWSGLILPINRGTFICCLGLDEENETQIAIRPLIIIDRAHQGRILVQISAKGLENERTNPTLETLI